MRNEQWMRELCQNGVEDKPLNELAELKFLLLLHEDRSCGIERVNGEIER